MDESYSQVMASKEMFRNKLQIELTDLIVKKMIITSKETQFKSTVPSRNLAKTARTHLRATGAPDAPGPRGVSDAARHNSTNHFRENKRIYQKSQFSTNVCMFVPLSRTLLTVLQHGVQAACHPLLPHRSCTCVPGPPCSPCLSQRFFQLPAHFASHLHDTTTQHSIFRLASRASAAHDVDGPARW